MGVPGAEADLVSLGSDSPGADSPGTERLVESRDSVVVGGVRTAHGGDWVFALLGLFGRVVAAWSSGVASQLVWGDDERGGSEPDGAFGMADV